MNPEFVGRLIGSLFACTLMVAGAWKLWRLGHGWSRALGLLIGLFIGLSFLGGLASGFTGKRPISVNDFEREFVQGCVKGCTQQGADAGTCQSPCTCMANRVRGSRSPDEFIQWLTEHAPNGNPDSIAMESIKSSAASCFSNL